MAFILVSCWVFSLAFRLVGFGAAVGLKSTDFQAGVGLQAVLHVGVQADLRDRFGPLFCTAFRIFFGMDVRTASGTLVVTVFVIVFEVASASSVSKILCLLSRVV